jgi:hypothetical protein
MPAAMLTNHWQAEEGFLDEGNNRLSPKRRMLLQTGKLIDDRLVSQAN